MKVIIKNVPDMRKLPRKIRGTNYSFWSLLVLTLNDARDAQEMNEGLLRLFIAKLKNKTIRFSYGYSKDKLKVKFMGTLTVLLVELDEETVSRILENE